MSLSNRQWMLFAVAVAAMGAASCDRAGSAGEARAPTPARQGLDGSGRMRPSSEDRCPVCAMEVTEHGRFASAIELRGGRTYYFCGTGCMIKSWLHPEVYLGAPPSELGRAVVREHFGGEHVDAAGVTFVAGSDVVGPMGPALVPLRTEEDVRTFRERHGGRETFRMSELDDARFEAITGKRALSRPSGDRR